MNEKNVNEKQGRVSKDPNHSKNVAFIKSYYNSNISPSNYSNYIKKAREQFLRAIELHDKELLKKLQDDSLESLKKLIDDYNIPMPKPARKRDWDVAEKDITNGINVLFKNNFFTFIGKNEQHHEITDENFIAKQAGGSVDSDIQISNIKKNKHVFIECKLGYESAEYFKFNIQVKNKKLHYDHSFHLRNLQPDDKEKMDLFFSKDLDISGFLNEVMQKPEVKEFWDQFLLNIDAVQTVIAEDEEFKEFASKVRLSQQFPDNVDALIKIFDTYVKYYEEKYDSLSWQLYDVLEDNGLDDPEDYLMIGDSGERSVSETFNGVNWFLDCIYMWKEKTSNFDDKQLKLDEKKMMALADEMKIIEAKISRILDKTHTSNAKELLNLPKSDKLRYFFAAFLSSTGHKKNGKHELVALQQDKLGNMVICPGVDVESNKLAKMICDYYMKKDNCIYIQVDDTIYALSKNYNLFQLPDIPCFEDFMTRFSIGLIVSYDMSKISLHIKAYEPDKSSFSGHQQLSFKQHDTNFVGKKITHIDIHA